MRCRAHLQAHTFHSVEMLQGGIALWHSGLQLKLHVGVLDLALNLRSDVPIPCNAVVVHRHVPRIHEYMDGVRSALIMMVVCIATIYPAVGIKGSFKAFSGALLKQQAKGIADGCHQQ